MTDLPSVGREDDDDLENLDLGKGRALTEFLGISYFPAYSVILLHRNRYAGRSRLLQNYLERMGAYGNIEFELVLTRDALYRLSKMHDCRSAEIRVSVPQNFRIQDPNDPISEVIGLAKNLRAVTVTTSVSMSHAAV